MGVRGAGPLPPPPISFLGLLVTAALCRWDGTYNETLAQG